MSKKEFIEQIAEAAKQLAPIYGIKVISPIIGQACLETGYGVGKGSEKKVAYHNYFGLKYRENRVTCHSGIFVSNSQEQKEDGTYISISTDWYAFSDLYSGVEGYLQFINIANYANLKGVTDPHRYLELIKEDGYATDLNYVEKVWKVIEDNNLQQYDNIIEEASMNYTNSSLVDCTRLSPNHSGERMHKIDRITPHCVVGQLSAEAIGKCFPKGRGASCNYGIGYDGKICLVVEEKNRSWCSSSQENDHRAITIEVASDKTAPYTFTEEAYKSLVELCVDICKRNGLTKVLWFGDKDKTLMYKPKDNECVLTVHRWFANKACPGDWMYSRMGQLAYQINKGLGSEEKAEDDVTIKQPGLGITLYKVLCGDYTNKDAAEILLADIKSSGVDNAFIVKKDKLYMVQAGAYSSYSNARAQFDKMKILGFDCFIESTKREDESFEPLKSVEEIAQEIWNGKCSDARWTTWGNGRIRERRLEAAGYDYNMVQKAIDELYRK